MLKPELFYAKVRLPGGPDSCMEWTAARNSAGYGVAWAGMKRGTILAHRLSHELFLGPIPDGLTVDHLCANRRCVRPDHLEAVTNEVNVSRGGRRRHGWDSGKCRRGHELTEVSLKYRTCRTCIHENRRKRRLAKKETPR